MKKAVPFICTLSPLVRTAAALDTESLASLKRIAGGVAEQIDGTPEVAASLRAPVPAGTAHMRQVDIRPTADGPVVVKTFTRWNAAHACWHVLIEGPDETHWEHN